MALRISAWGVGDAPTLRVTAAGLVFSAAAWGAAGVCRIAAAHESEAQ